MNSKLENFFLDRNVNDEVFSGQYGEIKIHKEKFNDRFEIIYSKNNRKTIKQEYYDVVGYYDTKDHCIYDPSNNIKEIIPQNGAIKTNTLANLENKFVKETKEYIIKYCLENESTLKRIAKEKYQSKDDIRFNKYQNFVKSVFIKEDNPVINLDFNNNELYFLKNVDFNNYLFDYLDNPSATIKNYSETIIEKNKEYLGIELYILQDKKDYLNEIKINKDNQFSELYLYKDIYSSIKYLGANTINITIGYGDKECTFKYDCSDLKYGLQRCDKVLGRYASIPYIISDFVKENTNKDYFEGFELSSIRKLTYGKNELFVKEEQKKHEIEEDIEIDR